MESYQASSVIKAEPERIWPILTDVSAYPEWDSGVERVEGTVGLGAKLKVFAEVSPGRAFPVKVSELVPDRRMVWSGGMPLGLFKGVRTYSLSPGENGTTTFTVREEYTGPLLPLIWRSMPDLQPSFDKFATGLKERVEGLG
ncbi:SRPBCC domain-containing protein [Acrocarpospora sp. B8E8]|uniref:SRPBCC domain-containing protein n=1 Tax=Acrocarpospora sp. B8E8 TaxID=3153572 RepID=UPI00325D445F